MTHRKIRRSKESVLFCVQAGDLDSWFVLNQDLGGVHYMGKHKGKIRSNETRPKKLVRKVTKSKKNNESNDEE